MKIRIEPGFLSGTVAAKPSKSLLHRVMLASALAGSIYPGNEQQNSADLSETAACITALIGKRLGGGLPLFPTRESGTTLRFMLPVSLALTGGGTFFGTERLFQRCIPFFERYFLPHGSMLTYGNMMADGLKPITLSGTLTPGEWELPGDVSSQYASGLLFALPLLQGDSTLRLLPPVESRPYIDMTIQVLREFGVFISETEPGRFLIPGGQTYHNPPAFALPELLEGDWSNAAPFLLLNTLGNDVRVTGLKNGSLQGDERIVRFLRILEKRDTDGLPEIDISDTPDLGPVLFSAAACTGGAVFTGIRRLRLKESDRVAAMASELSKFGIVTKAEENKFTVFPGALEKPGETVSAHGDHRIAMALSALLAKTGGMLCGAEAVGKSYPDFWADLRALGLKDDENDSEEEHK